MSSRNRGLTPHEKLNMIALDYDDRRNRGESLWSILERWDLSITDLSDISETSDVAWLGSSEWSWTGFRSHDAHVLLSLVSVYRATGKDSLKEYYSAGRSTVTVETMSELVF